MTKPTWITVNPNQGSGNTSVAVTATYNSGGYREGSMDIFVPGFPTTSVSVAQYPGDCALGVDLGLGALPSSLPNYYYVVSTFDYKTAKVFSYNSDGYKIIQDPSRSKSSVSDMFAFYISHSSSYVNGIIDIFTRRGGIVFRGSDIYADVSHICKHVSQLTIIANDHTITTDTHLLDQISTSYYSFVARINKVKLTIKPTEDFYLTLMIAGISVENLDAMRRLVTTPTLKLFLGVRSTETAFGGFLFKVSHQINNTSYGTMNFTTNTDDNLNEFNVMVSEDGGSEIRVSSSEYTSSSTGVGDICIIDFYSEWRNYRKKKNVVINFPDFRFISAPDTDAMLINTVEKLTIYSKYKQPASIHSDFVEILSKFISNINEMHKRAPSPFTLNLDIADMTSSAKTILLSIAAFPQFFTLNITVRS